MEEALPQLFLPGYHRFLPCVNKWGGLCRKFIVILYKCGGGRAFEPLCRWTETDGPQRKGLELTLIGPGAIIHLIGCAGNDYRARSLSGGFVPGAGREKEKAC